MKYLIVGGVAGGATAAARLRRNDEHAEIIPDNAPEQLQISQLSADRLKLLAAEEDSIP